MRFVEHSQTKRRLSDHAFLAPSQNAWLNYDREKLERRYKTAEAALIGVAIHKYAEDAINLGMKQAARKSAVNHYINDCIKHSMTPEVFLYYSDHCYGTVDAIKFDGQTLDIWDLKTGEREVKNFNQLLCYCALFCLEYDMDPDVINFNCRIYQFDSHKSYSPNSQEIVDVMDKIIINTDILNQIQQYQQL